MLCYRRSIKLEGVFSMSWLARTMVGIMAAAVAVAAPSQLRGTDGETFVTKVREGDNGAALELLEGKPIILNAQDSRGDTALLVAVQRRDTAWTAHLLRAGADPNLAARNGDTPLIVAVRSGFDDGARWLLDSGAKVDGANKMGETALIVAVQKRAVPVVKLLLSRGADPDRTDAAAGYSARDYARRDTRVRELLATIEASKDVAAKPVKPATEKLDDFKLD